MYTGLCLSLPKLHQACAWHHHEHSPFMIKYQETPHDILLVQQDGWNGLKVGCVFSLPHQHLPFFLSGFSFLPLLYKKYVLGKRDGFHSEKEIFSAEKETYIVVACTWCSCFPPSVCQHSLLFLPTPYFFLVFYLRSLSEGLTISSRVSLLSCCLCIVCDLLRPIRAAAHFSSPAWRGELRGDPRRSSQPWATLILLTWDRPYTHADAHSHYPDLSG